MAGIMGSPNMMTTAAMPAMLTPLAPLTLLITLITLATTLALMTTPITTWLGWKLRRVGAIRSTM
jgi:hypothetical protein